MKHIGKTIAASLLKPCEIRDIGNFVKTAKITKDIGVVQNKNKLRIQN